MSTTTDGPTRLDLPVPPSTSAAAGCWTRSRLLHKAFTPFCAAWLGALAGLQAGHGALLLDDSLQGATTGTRSGGAFVTGGWLVTGKNDSIYWHVPTIAEGAAEFDVCGLQLNERRTGMEDKAELFHMYDPTVGDADLNYSDGYRDNPFKHFIRKIGSLDAAKADAMEVVWQIRPNSQEPDTARLGWTTNTTYHFREEWGPDGAGNSVLKLFRDGVLLLTTSVSGAWKPTGHSVRIAASPRRDPAAGAPVGAIFSNVKVWNLANATNVVRLKGKSFCDESGPFLGLGVSYFQALRHAKYDRARLNRNLALFAAKGFNYVRVLSMVSWDGLEIAPVSFTNRAGRAVQGWPDYWQQFRDLLDLVAQHGLRAEVTIFADAQYVMPPPSIRQAHLDGILANIAGREPHILHLEVANEAWQNGFPGAQGIAELRTIAQYLGDRTHTLVAITSNDDTSDEGISALYRGSAADLATVHFSRDTRTPEGGWLPVRDAYRAGNLPGVPPVSSNEPIGPGSSVSSESDPIELCAAAVFAYIANLPSYVYHSRAGVYGYVKCCPAAGGEDRFEDTAGINAYQHLRPILPPDLSSWTRNDGLEPSAPFTVFCDGQPNRYWPEHKGASNGCHRNIGSAKGSEFVCFPMGILGGGVTFEARRPLQFQVINPLTGVAQSNLTLNLAERCTLPQGPGAYLLKGTLRSRSRGTARVEETRPKHFPHRIWAACDFEAHTPDYAWFGPPETNNIPRYPGNVTALGAGARPDQNFSAVMTGINPVPGPCMGKVNQLYLRYFLRGGTEATFQHFSLTSEDNNHIRVSGLTEAQWSDVTLNFTRDGQRNDGTPGVPFKEGERMDDLKIFVGQPGDGKRHDLVIDDVIFFATDPDLPPEPEPFPNRVIFLAAFDTGATPAEKPKYWPGEFEMEIRDVPAGSNWNVARAVPQKNAKGKWIRLQITPPRPVGAHTKLRFRYHLAGASQMTVQLFDATDNDNRHIRLRDLRPGAWQTVYLDFTQDARRNDGRDTPFAAGHLVDDLFFFVEPVGDREVALFIDEVVLFDAGQF